MITFAVDPKTHIVRTTYAGHIRWRDVVTYAMNLVDENALGLAQLIDGRSATLEMTAQETREIAHLMGFLRAEFGAAPVAFVPGDAASYAVAKSYADLGAGANPHFQVFDDVAAAEVWLAIEGRHPG